uniref:Sugar transporter SWEET1 n=1 Tax=Syphacia muris TaxID=451379 RepID=A0A0N5ANA6_9BILA
MLLSIFALWLTAFSISFSFLPMLQVFDWKRRGTAEGFSSINFVLPCLMTACWLRHGYMINDKINMFINAANIIIFTGYISAFAYYQTKRKYLYGQLLGLFVSLYAIFTYVDSQPTDTAADTMGSIAAAMQIFSLTGQLYEIKRAISFKHTEYIPAELQFGIFALVTQWVIYALLIKNYYIAIANFAALIVNIITLSLFIIYPPLTWRVPIFGTGPQKKD